jgi:excisionase family DNA binding protein
MPGDDPEADGDEKPSSRISSQESSDVMTLSEVAEFLRFNEEHTRRLAARGELGGWKIGSTWRFSRSELLRRLRGSRGT